MVSSLETQMQPDFEMPLGVEDVLSLVDTFLVAEN